MEILNSAAKPPPQMVFIYAPLTFFGSPTFAHAVFSKTTLLCGET
jgi:hypothetical protein